MTRSLVMNLNEFNELVTLKHGPNADMTDYVEELATQLCKCLRRIEHLEIEMKKCIQFSAPPSSRSF